MKTMLMRECVNCVFCCGILKKTPADAGDHTHGRQSVRPRQDISTAHATSSEIYSEADVAARAWLHVQHTCDVPVMTCGCDLNLMLMTRSKEPGCLKRAAAAEQPSAFNRQRLEMCEAR